MAAREQDSERKISEFIALIAQNINKKYYHIANNIGLNISFDDLASENVVNYLVILRDIINFSAAHQDFYNGARVITEVADCLPSGVPFDPREREQLIDAYHFAHTERLARLSDLCHSGLWKAFEAEGDIENLLRLYRSSSFIWRIHNRENIEQTYLQNLGDRPDKIVRDSRDI